MKRRQFLFGLAALNCACTSTRQPQAIALVASSLQPWLSNHAARFNLSCSYGGSHNLVLQAERGAPVTLLLLAYSTHIAGFTDPLAFASNQLVLVCLKGKPSLQDGVRIAVGDPKLAPVGRFAQEAMQRLKIQPEWVFTRDDRSSLTLLESGHVKQAIVYASDIQNRHLGQPLPLDCSPINYFFLQRKDDPRGEAFAAWLKTTACQQSLKEFGLLVYDT